MQVERVSEQALSGFTGCKRSVDKYYSVLREGINTIPSLLFIVKVNFAIKIGEQYYAISSIVKITVYVIPLTKFFKMIKNIIYLIVYKLRRIHFLLKNFPPLIDISDVNIVYYLLCTTPKIFFKKFGEMNDFFPIYKV